MTDITADDVDDAFPVGDALCVAGTRALWCVPQVTVASTTRTPADNDVAVRALHAARSIGKRSDVVCSQRAVAPALAGAVRGVLRAFREALDALEGGAVAVDADKVLPPRVIARVGRQR